jgi:hypothetical protein|eukprot:2520738-Prymnesium_polylepis.2
MRAGVFLLLLAVVGAKRAQIALMIPQTGVDSDHVLWKQVTCAALLAVKHVRTRDDSVVQGLAALTSNLTVVAGSVYDTGYKPSPAIRSYRIVLKDGGYAIVAAARSAVSTPLAQLGAIDRMPQASSKPLGVPESVPTW